MEVDVALDVGVEVEDPVDVPAIVVAGIRAIALNAGRGGCAHMTLQPHSGRVVCSAFKVRHHPNKPELLEVEVAVAVPVPVEVPVSEDVAVALDVCEDVDVSACIANTRWS